MTAISNASGNEIFVNKLIISNKIKNLSILRTNLISSINVKLFFMVYLDGIWGERREPKYGARWQNLSVINKNFEN